MKKNALLLLVALSLVSCVTQKAKVPRNKANVNLIIDNWHKAAADANYDAYFDLMATDAVFIGTDATENWNRTAFEKFAKPHFDKGKAWAFHPLERNVFIGHNGKYAWFDELLDTSFKICRGSGVLEYVDNQWKIKHYVLSFTIPNDISKEVVASKDVIESALIKSIKAKK